MTETPTQQADRLAKSLYPELAERSPSAARSKVWTDSPDLREAHALVREATTAPAAPKFSKSDVQHAADTLAREKIDREPARFRKINDPNARLAAARSEVYREHPELVEADHTAR